MVNDIEAVRLFEVGDKVTITSGTYAGDRGVVIASPFGMGTDYLLVMLVKANVSRYLSAGRLELRT